MSKIYFEVQFDFAAEEEGELSIYKGEIVSSTTEVDEDGWMLVVSEDNATGFVPKDYLKVTQQPVSPSSSVQSLPTIQSQASDNSLPPPPSNTTSGAVKSLIAPSNQPVNEVPVSVVQPHQAPQGTTPANSSNNFPLTTNMLSPAPSTTAASPFPLRNAGSTNNQSGVYTPSNMSVASTTNSTLNSANKISLMKATKSIINTNRAVSQFTHSKLVAPPRAPALLASVERDNLDDLLKKNNEYFSRVLSSQGDTLDSVSDMVDALTKKLGDAAQVYYMCACAFVRMIG